MITMRDVNKKILTKLKQEKNIKPQTEATYEIAVNLYCKLNNMNLLELLKEAEMEEEAGVRWKKRKLRQRLIHYRAYLFEHYKLSTAKIYLIKISAIYRHFEIEIHPLPSISTRNAKVSPPINYDDLLTKEEIREVIKVSNPQIRAITLFMLSSGCARTETLNLTIQDFINSVQEYTDKTDIYEVIEELKNKNNIVPTFRIQRQKTNKYYHTFCTPETTNYIISHLQSRDEILTPDKKLFDIHQNYLVAVFSQLNEKLHLGSAGEHNRLRTHALRKFNASNLCTGDNALNFDDIDALQGRGKTLTREAYFKTDPTYLKKKYIANMEQVTINQEIRKLKIDSPEVLAIKKENRELKENYKKMKEETKKETKKYINSLLKELDLL